MMQIINVARIKSLIYTYSNFDVHPPLNRNINLEFETLYWGFQVCNHIITAYKVNFS